MIEIARITVPARFKNSHARVTMFWKTVRKFGTRYGGSSIRNGGGGAFNSVRLRMKATITATIIPNEYIASMRTAPSEINPNTVRPAKNAAIISEYTGSRAEQLM